MRSVQGSRGRTGRSGVRLRFDERASILLDRVSDKVYLSGCDQLTANWSERRGLRRTEGSRVSNLPGPVPVAFRDGLRLEDRLMASEITCVTTSRNPRGRGGIEQIGGHRWTKDLETVIADIEQGLEYFIQVGAARIVVVIGEGKNGGRTVRADPDSINKNILFSLPSCPQFRCD